MSKYEKTPDGRHFIVNGRKWRATDPSIPAPLEAQLVAVLMKARRDVKKAKQEKDASLEKHARNRVHDAKIALGERGREWWKPYEEDALRIRLRSTMLTLLRHRDPEKSICPSEAARVVGSPDDWRPLMPIAREVAVGLAHEKIVIITRGEEVLSPDDLGRGHIRIRCGKRNNYGDK